VTDRLAEVRARLEAWREVRYPQPSTTVLVDDVAWLLDEVQRLTARVRMYEEVKS
jgi:alkylation response protein AidB-like acyl-CoA dehydrogenase